jgi:glycosyltransferase involved in cell wall biosynthesis
MTRLAFYLDTRALGDIDLSQPELGNPGVGGSEYMFFLVAARLARDLEVHLYAPRLGRFPAGIHYHQVADLAEAAARFRDHGERWVVLRESEIPGNLAALAAGPAQILAWAHNYSNPKTLRACLGLPNLARYVCVSREQYENLRDERIFPKCAFVFNAAAADAYRPGPDGPLGNDVFFMGSIHPQKGFHVLARNWDAIRRAVPDARLHIVGSGQLYDRRSVMGPLGIAEAGYERELARHLARDGRLRDDVVFHGTLGAGKNDLLRTAKVAVVNPTGQGETFCISALEFELLGVPVVTRDLGGPRNVVASGRTGILFRREAELAPAVIRLLQDESLRSAMAREAPAFARDRFDIGPVARAWKELVQALENGRPPEPDYRLTSAGRLTRAKECNRRLKALPGLGWLPSLDCVLHALRKRRHSLLVKPWRRLRAGFQ